MAVASGMKLCVKRARMCVTNRNEDQTIRNKAKCLEVLSCNKEWEKKRVSVFMSVLHIITDLRKYYSTKDLGTKAAAKSIRFQGSPVDDATRRIVTS